MLEPLHKIVIINPAGTRESRDIFGLMKQHQETKMIEAYMNTRKTELKGAGFNKTRSPV